MGTYADATGTTHGFLFNSGTYSPVDFPGALTTSALGINNTGQIVGTYYDGTATSSFLLSGGMYSALAVPSGAWAYGINNSGEVVGIDGSLGFVSAGGSFTTIALPGALATQAKGINDSGQIVGVYCVTTCQFGFFLSGGVNAGFDFPGAVCTAAAGISNSGQIVGGYSSDGTTGHGFLATPVPEPSTSVPLGCVFAWLIVRRARWAPQASRRGQPCGAVFVMPRP